jgi:spore coat polysaccharide biosynthesis protein SpsF
VRALIIQARMGSTRLPGKVLRPINGRPLFSYQLERMKRCRLVDLIVVATTTEPADDAIVSFCKSQSTLVTRGSEQDVLRRYAEAARAVNADTVVRVTSDCPLLDPQLVDAALESFAGPDGPDYVSNMLKPTWPYGMAVEVMSRAALDAADNEAMDASEREHVTPFIYWRPQRFRLKSMTLPVDLSAHRWTVDTIEDFDLVSRVLDALLPVKPQFQMHDVLELLERHPDWVEINQGVSQKSIARASKESM